LGVPLRVTLGYPAVAVTDPQADPEFKVGAGRWHGSFHADVQAEWAAAFVALALCKPSVRGVLWTHLTDAAPHQFPQAGLYNASDHPRPVLRQLRQLREAHLR